MFDQCIDKSCLGINKSILMRQ